MLFLLYVALPGGLAAVIYTDTLQTVIMVIGSFILMGFGELLHNYPVFHWLNYLNVQFDHKLIYLSFALHTLCAF